MKLSDSEYTEILDLLHASPWDAPATPAAPPCGYVNRADDVTECAPDQPDHDTANDIRARMRATGGYEMDPFPGLPEPMGLNWHGSDYRTR